MKIKTAVIVPHLLHLDPRIKWLANGFNQDLYDLYLFGINSYGNNTFIEFKEQHNNIQKIELIKIQNPVGMQDYLNLKNIPEQLQQIIQLLQNNCNSKNLRELKDQADFQCLCQHILDIMYAMVLFISRFNDFNLIIAADFDSLLTGAILASYYKVPLVYDAHEHWSESFLWKDKKYANYLMQIEKDLVANYVDLPITVTPQLADIFTQAYGKPYTTVPNAETFNILSGINHNKSFNKLQNDPEKCTFLVQGNYAPGRGFEKLIKLWQKTPSNCFLYLRGPMNDYCTKYKELTAELGLLNQRIFFLEPVLEDELVLAAQQADVGIIPYEPEATINHQYCCPNKLSQYMAAHLPIISNNLDFVAQTLEESQSGISVDFNDETAFLATINELASNAALRQQYGENGFNYFCKSFNWDVLSKIAYEKITDLDLKKSLVTTHVKDYIHMLNDFLTRNLVDYPQESKPTVQFNLWQAGRLAFNAMVFWLPKSVQQKLRSNVLLALDKGKYLFKTR